MHHLRFELTPEQVDAFADGPVLLAIDHPAYLPAYLEQVELSDTTQAELLIDLRA